MACIRVLGSSIRQLNKITALSRAVNPIARSSPIAIQRCLLHATARVDQAQLIDGKKLSAEIRNEVKQEVADWMAAGNQTLDIDVATSVIIAS